MEVHDEVSLGGDRVGIVRMVGSNVGALGGFGVGSAWAFCPWGQW